MCGIAGLINPYISPETRRAAVANMLESMPHRGPDDQGSIELDQLSMGMIRLAIFGPAHGH
ncbi:MAG: hypothetical protein J6386_05525 [Candidatus Synoicihabitans palmerolidicus]|nr:hypothetical protein [Candidatus Synoicihabitans palmerolidicus]